MKTILHINQHIIKSNSKNNENNPVITCKTYKTNEYAHQAIIYDKDNNEVCRIVYSKDKPLSCGAKVYIQTDNRVELINELNSF
jgi:hypothetical protein